LVRRIIRTLQMSVVVAVAVLALLALVTQAGRLALQQA
jgi:hypothetical protein